MIDDIVFDVTEFIMEIPYGVAGGDILSYSLDGGNYNFIESSGGETSSVFVN